MRQSLNSLAMEWTTDWVNLFGSDRPLIVEIGFGNADYLIALAEAHKDCNIIGFEISTPSLEKAEKKIHNHNLSNIIAIHSRGETAINHLFELNSIREIHINYPDPWFKSKHAGRRIMQPDMLDAIVSRLEIGGLFYLATDIEEYAQMSHELLVETHGLTNELDAKWLNHLPERLITTKYEGKGFREGRLGHYFKYRRNENQIPNVPVKKEWEMPHIIINTPMKPQEIAAAVEKEIFHKGDSIHVALFNGYWNPTHNTVLFEVNIEEATIEQHIALSLRYRDEKDDYVLRYATFGMPRPTEGMHFATRIIAEWLISLHPDAKIIVDKTKKQL